jgi:HemY protein
MKRRLIKILFILALLLLVFVVSLGDGYLLIAYGNKTIEMTLTIALLILLAILFCLWCLRLFFRGGRGIIRGFRKLFGIDGDATAATKRPS